MTAQESDDMLSHICIELGNGENIPVKSSNSIDDDIEELVMTGHGGKIQRGRHDQQKETELNERRLCTEGGRNRLLLQGQLGTVARKMHGVKGWLLQFGSSVEFGL